MRKTLLAVAAITALVLGGGGSACESGHGRSSRDPAALVLTAADLNLAPSEAHGGPTDLLDEASADLRAALLPVPGRIDWRAYGVDFRRIGVASLAVVVRDSAMAKTLLRVATSLTRFEGMTPAHGSGSRAAIGEEAVLLIGTVDTPRGHLRGGGTVVFRRDRIVGVVVAQTLAEAVRLALIQAKTTQ